MELEPVPHRLTRGERRRFLLGLLVLLPVLLLVLVPPALGLDRFVITDRSMDGTLGRGSVALARDVPTADLEVGDVITFEEPGPEEGLVTRRIVSIDGMTATTRGDAHDAVDPWTLELTEAVYPRLLFGVPWVGYPFTGDVGSGGWTLLALVAAVALVLGSGRVHLEALRPRNHARRGARRHLHV
jgi:signal peptidase